MLGDLHERSDGLRILLPSNDAIAVAQDLDRRVTAITGSKHAHTNFVGVFCRDNANVVPLGQIGRHPEASLCGFGLHVPPRPCDDIIHAHFKTSTELEAV
jgi:hypothetical protein